MKRASGESCRPLAPRVNLSDLGARSAARVGERFRSQRRSKRSWHHHCQRQIDTATDGFADNERLYLPPTVFNRFAVTREINDGSLAPRFSPSQRGWVLSGSLVKVSPTVDASAGRDGDDR